MPPFFYVLFLFRLGERSRLLHLQLLTVIRELLKVVPLSLADRCIPRTLKDALVVNIMDPCVRLLYPRLHQDLLMFVQVSFLLIIFPSDH